MRWRPTIWGSDDQHSLYIHASEVARVFLQDGRWRAVLRLGDRTKYRDCTDKETGMAACEQWAARHRERFNADYERQINTGVFRAFNTDKSDRPDRSGDAS